MSRPAKRTETDDTGRPAYTTTVRLWRDAWDELKQIAHEEQRSRARTGVPIGKADASAILRDILDKYLDEHHEGWRRRRK